MRGQRQTRTENHVDPDAGPARPERRDRTLLRQQVDGRVEPEQNQPQRQRAIQVRGHQRGRLDPAAGQRGRAHQARSNRRDQRVGADKQRGPGQVYRDRESIAFNPFPVSRHVTFRNALRQHDDIICTSDR